MSNPLFTLEGVINSTVETRTGEQVTQQASIIVNVSRSTDRDESPLVGANGTAMSRREWLKIYAYGPNAKWLQGLQVGDSFIADGGSMRPPRKVEGRSIVERWTDKAGQPQEKVIDGPWDLHDPKIWRVETSHRQAQEQLQRPMAQRHTRSSAVVEQQAAPAAAPAVAPAGLTPELLAQIAALLPQS